MKIKVQMVDSKWLYVNRILNEQRTFTVSSNPVDLNQFDLEKVKTFEPSMRFQVE